MRILLTAFFMFLSLAAALPKKSETVVLNFQNADIPSVVRFMSELTGKKIILDPEVKGKITLSSSKPVSIQEAWELFSTALGMQGYGVVEKKGFVQILPLQKAIPFAPIREKPSPSGFSLYIYKAENTQASQLQQAVQPFLSQYGKLAVHNQSNSLIVGDIPPSLERIKKILKELDKSAHTELRVYSLEKARADSIVQSLQPLLQAYTQEGKHVFVTANRDTNTVIVLAEKSLQEGLGRLIKELDEKAEFSEERSFHVIPLRFVSAEEVYKSLSSLLGGFRTFSPTPPTPSPSLQPTPSLRGEEIPLRREQPQRPQETVPPAIQTREGLRIGYDRGTNSLLVYATPKELEDIKKLIKKLDVRRKQVLIAASVVEMSTTKALDLGVRWQILGTQGGGAFGGSTLQDISSALLSGNFVLGLLSSSGRSITVGGTNLFFPDLVLLFSLLEKGTGFNLLSNPKLLTLDNQPAEIKVGQVVPFASGVKFDINGQPVITYDYKEVGLDLRITPSVSEKNLRLSISLQVQEIIDFLRPQIGTLSYAVPVTSNRQVNSEVVVENGQTIIIGGLINTRTLKSTEGAPGLKDVPVLGWLFKRKTTQEDKVSLFIFITPYVIESPEELSRITQEHQKLADELRKAMEKR